MYLSSVIIATVLRFVCLLLTVAPGQLEKTPHRPTTTVILIVVGAVLTVILGIVVWYFQPLGPVV